MRTPSLKAIKTFQIAGKHSSFAVAADELCITPSAVSHQIKTLETQLGHVVPGRWRSPMPVRAISSR
jgi:LysR family transcriptional regulator, glycine cleavage system transcriptional activator